MAKISISVEQIEEIVTKLNSARAEIEKEWKSIKSTELTQIKESWVGKDCETYVQQIESMDQNIQNTLMAQQKLAEAFEKAKNSIIDVQEQLVRDANNL